MHRLLFKSAHVNKPVTICMDLMTKVIPTLTVYCTDTGVCILWVGVYLFSQSTGGLRAMPFTTHRQFFALWNIRNWPEIFFLINIALLTEAFNSTKGQYISTHTHTHTHTHTYIYIYIYIYIYFHPQTDCFVVSQLNRVARHARCFKLESKPGWLYTSRISYYRANVSVNEGILTYIYVFTR